jgi:membrane protein DedA with SNARE-associated domain
MTAPVELVLECVQHALMCCDAVVREAGHHVLQTAQSMPGSAAAASSPAVSDNFAFVINILHDWGYAGIVFMLLLCGLGLPIPEEVTLIGSGYLSYVAQSKGSDHPDWLIASAVCVFGILLGDTVVYSLGRRFGNSLLKLPIVRHELTPARLAKFDKLFYKYGDRAIFFSRFFMGVRLASYFVAGRQRMPYWKFILLDLGGALLSGPTSVAFGFYFGAQIERAFELAHESNRILIGIVIAIIVGMIVYTKVRSNRARARARLPG